MQHFPIFLSLRGESVAVSGGGEAAIAKLRLLLKTEAILHVYAEAPAATILGWADEGRVVLHRRPLDASGPCRCAARPMPPTRTRQPTPAPPRSPAKRESC